MPFNAARLDLILADHDAHRRPRFNRLWNYYRNHTTPGTPGSAPGSDGSGVYHLAQEAGLPRRIRRPANGVERECVIENDIAWRLDTLVEFMFGKPVTIHSTHPDHARGAAIEQFLRQVFDHAGGVQFFQNMALLGSVYGHVDLLVRHQLDHCSTSPASRIAIDLVDATRGIGLVHADDYRRLEAFALRVDRMREDDDEPNGVLARIRQRLGRPTASSVETQTLVYTCDQEQRYVERPGMFNTARRLVETELNKLNRVPVVHIQNLPLPFSYEGLSDVEPLIPLQDELNTRLSDRANRVTFQSFKMYLGRGIDGFLDRPVGPGQMWQTDNPDAEIQEFGGGGLDPSETAHIDEIREALDKTSGVSPVAAGLIRDRIGNLTSENALRITLMGVIARIQRKRLTYGRGIEDLCQLILQTADVHGLFRTHPDERAVRLSWPDPLPQNERQQLDNAAKKLELGVPRRTVLAELGYDEIALT